MHRDRRLTLGVTDQATNRRFDLQIDCIVRCERHDMRGMMRARAPKRLLMCRIALDHRNAFTAKPERGVVRKRLGQQDDAVLVTASVERQR